MQARDATIRSAPGTVSGAPIPTAFTHDEIDVLMLNGLEKSLEMHLPPSERRWNKS